MKNNNEESEVGKEVADNADKSEERKTIEDYPAESKADNLAKNDKLEQEKQ